MAATANPIEPILARALAAAGRAAEPLRRQILTLTARRLPAAAFLNEARKLIAKAEPQLRAILQQAVLASYLLPVAPLVKQVDRPAYRPDDEFPEVLPAPLPAPFGPSRLLPPPEQPPTVIIATGDYGDVPPPIRFPLIERAARDLFRRDLFTRADFDALNAESKQLAFTVSRVNSLDTLGKLRDLLTESAAQGTSLRQFQSRAAEVLEDSPLSRPHLETVFRTNLATAYSTGQREILDHPLIGDEFPYVLWTAVHDSRVRSDHLAMEKAGIQGTAIYRRDDPLIQQAWPPASFNCRCHVIPLSLEDAAGYGIREALIWLQTGEPPATPAWVKSVPIIQPAGWVSSGVALAV